MARLTALSGSPDSARVCTEGVDGPVPPMSRWGRSARAAFEFLTHLAALGLSPTWPELSSIEA